MRRAGEQSWFSQIAWNQNDRMHGSRHQPQVWCRGWSSSCSIAWNMAQTTLAVSPAPCPEMWSVSSQLACLLVSTCTTHSQAICFSAVLLPAARATACGDEQRTRVDDDLASGDHLFDVQPQRLDHAGHDLHMGAGLVQVFLALVVQALVDRATQCSFVHLDPAKFGFKDQVLEFAQLGLVEIVFFHDRFFGIASAVAGSMRPEMRWTGE